MKKIAVTGGKGGTGKSTIAVLLANKYLSQDKKVILVDADIECPNDYLLVGEKLTNPQRIIKASYPVLNKQRCTKCGKCVGACKENVIFQKPGEYPQFLHDLCSSCGACWEICPENAIEQTKKPIGRIYLNQIKNNKKKDNNLNLVTGEAKAHLEETGPVVKETLHYAEKFAENKGIDIMLIDTAAGTHCPVINALLRTEKAYIVTEPTPMGAYDLKIIVKLIDKLNLPAEIILNQANLGDQNKVKKISKKHNKNIKTKIKHSNKIAQAYMKGKLLKLNENII